ncbi:MAG: tetrahydrofolate dehydrogenase/cyclohydrolase catalytic domain-containing protein, partial [Candidatus Marinimicrobia bacterium]|nr:tetrahydrofolate dehydrogenase/cyclohydrolase catalytic domain-containing protein [Candidatus Neomarinimicrobiota bacterium]
MFDTKILSGVEASHALYDSLHDRIHALKEKGVTPGLAAILVGEDPASQIYVRNKTKRFDALGLKSELYRLEDSVSEQEV